MLEKSRRQFALENWWKIGVLEWCYQSVVGVSFWSVVLEFRFGVSFWNVECRFQSVVLECRFGVSFWSDVGKIAQTVCSREFWWKFGVLVENWSFGGNVGQSATWFIQEMFSNVSMDVCCEVCVESWSISNTARTILLERVTQVTAPPTVVVTLLLANQRK